MYKSLFFAKSFWTSKLGQAAFASIAAMSAMVVFSTQFEASEAHAASLSHPPAGMVAMVEIA